MNERTAGISTDLTDNDAHINEIFTYTLFTKKVTGKSRLSF